MLEPRSLTTINHLLNMMETSSGTADFSNRALMVRHLYLLAEDLIGRFAASDLDSKVRIQLLIITLKTND